MGRTPGRISPGKNAIDRLLTAFNHTENSIKKDLEFFWRFREELSTGTQKILQNKTKYQQSDG